MGRHSKNVKLMVRLTREQRDKLTRAARIETERRRETVDLSTLLRELAMAEIDRILAEVAQLQEAS